MPAERTVLRVGAAALVLLGLVAGGVPLLVGPPGGDDAYYHAMYAQQHAWCWRHGDLHPRWYPGLNDGLGSPEPRRRPLAALVAQAAIALALDDAVAATSLTTLLMPPLAGLLMLAAARRRGAGAGPAVLAGAAWATAPYLLIAVHQRAALQEAAALALLPVALVALLPPAAARSASLPSRIVALAGLAATHLLVTFTAGAVAAVACLGSGRRAFFRFAGVCAGGLALAAASWLPNVVSLRRTASGTFTHGWFDWRQRFLLGATDPDPVLAWHLTLVLGALVAAAVLLAAAERGDARNLAAGALATTLLTTPVARWVWELVPGMAFLQFPWRWLGIASCVVVLSLAVARRRWVRLGAAAIVLAPALMVPWLEWRLPPGGPLRPSDLAEVVADAATRYGVASILPADRATLPRGVDLGAAVARGEAARRTLPQPLASGPREWRWRLAVPGAATVTLPLLADPAWRASVDGVATDWHDAGGGLVAVALAAGEHDVRLRQTVLWEEWAGAAVTLATLAAIVVLRRRRSRSRPAASA